MIYGRSRGISCGNLSPRGLVAVLFSNDCVSNVALRVGLSPGLLIHEKGHPAAPSRARRHSRKDPCGAAPFLPPRTRGCEPWSTRGIAAKVGHAKNGRRFQK